MYIKLSVTSANVFWSPLIFWVIAIPSITEADKGQSQNIQEIRKNVFKIRKNISNRDIFLEIVVEEFIKSEKLLQILIKLLNPQILFCKFQTNLQIQKYPPNPEKIFLQIRKKYFATCYLSQQSASVRVLPYPKWRRSVCELICFETFR